MKSKEELEVRKTRRKLTQTRRAYSKKRANDEFDRLIRNWKTSDRSAPSKELVEFQHLGRFQQKLFNKAFNKSKATRKNSTQRKKKLTFNFCPLCGKRFLTEKCSIIKRSLIMKINLKRRN